MNLSWSNRVIKYVLFVFNFVLVLTGIILIAVGVTVKAYYSDYDIFLNSSYFSLPNLLIAIGSLIFFISFFGCCGAIRESWFMIFIFAVLLSIIFIMEFSAGIAGYVLRDNTKSYLTDHLKESIPLYSPDKKNDGTTAMWDAIQSDFQCCGATGPNDWIDRFPTVRSFDASSSETPTTPSTTASSSSEATAGSSSEAGASSTTEPSITTADPSVSITEPSITTAEPSVSSTEPSITPETTSTATHTPASSSSQTPPPDDKDQINLPLSCCKSVSGATTIMYCNTKNTSNTATVYTAGCVDQFGQYLRDHAVTIGGAGLALAFIQLFGVIFACHLARQLKHGFYST